MKLGLKGKIRMLAFVLPLLILTVVSILCKVYPFGDRCILHVDMYHQYVPFTAELMEKLKTFGSPFYSWNIGLGSDFVATYAYYLASPLNLLLFLFPRSALTEGMTFLIYIKIAFCSLFMLIYLEHRYRRLDPFMLIPALAYAFSGFIAAYYWDIMWLDPVALFPLILLGMERLLKNGKWGLYAVSLALAIWSNYYISIMICIFLVLWFFLQLPVLAPPGRRGIAFVRMSVISVLSAGVSACLLFPEISCLGISGSGNNAFPTASEVYYHPLEGLARGLFDMTVTETEGKLPNLYCGVAVLFLMVLYVLNRSIRPMDKIRMIGLLLFFQLSFLWNVTDYIWHGFHFPEGLPARQSFLYVFVVLLVCYEAHSRMRYNTRKEFIIAAVASVGGVLLLWAVMEEKVLPNDIAALNLILLLIYIVIYGVLFFGKRREKAIAVLSLMAFCTLEVAANFYLTGISTTSRTEYVKNLAAVRSLTSAQQETDQEFWRVEKYERMMKDENLLSSYPAASLFSSLVNSNVADTYHTVGMEGGKNYYCYNGATPLFSAMLQVKYMLMDTTEAENPLRTLVAEQDGMALYENRYALPLGFLVDPFLEEKWIRSGSSVSNINSFSRALGAGDLLIPVGTNETVEEMAAFTPTDDAYLYAEMSRNDVQSVNVIYDGDVRTLSKTVHHYLLDLGYIRGNTTVYVKASGGQMPELTVYRLDMEALEQAYSVLSSCTMMLSEKKDTRIRGSVTADRDGILAFGIPAESGWEVFVDGKLKESKTFMNSYLAIPIENGYHKIELKYHTPGFAPGLAVSLASTVGLGILYMMKKRKRR